jgi:hypothetical protein
MAAKKLPGGWIKGTRPMWVVVDPSGTAYMSSASTLSRSRAIQRWRADCGKTSWPWSRWYRWGYRTARVLIATKTIA